MTNAVAALPIRSFRDAYRRLAGALDPERRASLAVALASHTAEAVREAGPLPLIVSSAPEVREWASDRGYDIRSDPPGGGLNAAARKIVRLAGDRPWLILHSDLPCLTSGEVEAVLEVLLAGRHVLAPSYDGGTSALGGHGRFPFAYGVASFHRHLAARPAPAVISSLGFQLDIDSPADLFVAARHPRGAWLSDRG
ncbi:MAG: 2-phospho-L-lactate guanylyltransferase [bacterium]|nr:2-phospho-L-lactate guanylyltransferase [bacterium]MDE0289312.1 2-phospho-L-lactate guanylyltransferase [bacterium]MDE0440278.1 2-phospho-L-lactate guanylyltransferase [bacterium]